jgi:hypothetical protein
MEYQKPAEGILLNNDFGVSKFYTVPCSCGNTDDEINVEVEADDAGVTVHVWTTTKSKWWSNLWYERFFNKLVMTWEIWTKGYVKVESWTMLNRQAAYNFAETLKSATNDVEEFRKQRNEEKRNS